MSRAADIVRSSRTLIRRPGFLLLAAGTLSLGTAALIGALTLLDAVLGEAPPWPNHAKVAVYGGRTVEDPMRAVSPHLYELVGRPPEARSRGIARIPESVNVVYGPRRALLRAQRVDGGFLPTLGVLPALGTLLTAQPGSQDVMVSYPLWRGWLDRDPLAVGRTVLVDGRSMRIVGVLPPAYRFFTDVDLIMPLATPVTSDDTAENLTAVALMERPGDVEAFSAHVSRIAAAHAGALRLTPQDVALYGATLLDLLLSPGAGMTLWLCMGCALLVMTVAGMNVSNLMLTRALSRVHETSLKLALGATGWRPWLPAFHDALAVGILAAAIGTPFGALLVVGLRDFLPQAWLSSAVPLAPAWRVIAVVLVITVLVAQLAAGSASVGVRVEPRLRNRLAAGGESTAGKAARRAHAAIVLAQTALATLLLTLGVAAALSWWRIEQVPLGFDRSDAMAMELRPGVRQYPELDDVLRLLDTIRARALQLPGVTFVGWSTQLPVDERFVAPFVMADGTTAHLQYTLATPGALEAMGLRRVAGRWFDDSDGKDTERVAVVNEAYVARFGDGVGGFVRNAAVPDQAARIVGVAGDARREGATAPVQPMVFVPLAQVDAKTFAFVRELASFDAVLRGPGMAPAAVSPFARVARDTAPALALGRARSLDQVARSAYAAPRRDALLLMSFALLATALAGVGHYSVQAVDVASRRRAFALRGALGASPLDLAGKVVRRALATTFPAVVIGLLAAFALHRWLRQDGGGPAAPDAWVFVTVTLAMTLVTILAVALPALRAAAVEPWRVVRND